MSKDRIEEYGEVWLDWTSKNTSFVDFCKKNKSVFGIDTAKYLLRICNPKLIGVNPTDDTLSDGMKQAIINECALNPLYLLREILLDSNGEKFRMDYAKFVWLYLAINGQPCYASYPGFGNQRDDFQAALVKMCRVNSFKPAPILIIYAKRESDSVEFVNRYRITELPMLEDKISGNDSLLLYRYQGYKSNRDVRNFECCGCIVENTELMDDEFLSVITNFYPNYLNTVNNRMDYLHSKRDPLSKATKFPILTNLSMYGGTTEHLNGDCSYSPEGRLTMLSSQSTIAKANNYAYNLKTRHSVTNMTRHTSHIDNIMDNQHTEIVTFYFDQFQLGYSIPELLTQYLKIRQSNGVSIAIDYIRDIINEFCMEALFIDYDLADSVTKIVLNTEITGLYFRFNRGEYQEV